MSTHSLRVDSDFSEVPALARQLKGVWLSMGLPEAETLPLEICIVEAVNNAIEHAYGGKAGHWVDVTTTLTGGTLVTEVSDQGTALDAGRLAGAGALDYDATDLDALPERGMGLAIMKEVMDAVHYESRAGGNRLTLTKKITHNGADEARGASREK